MSNDATAQPKPERSLGAEVARTATISAAANAAGIMGVLGGLVVKHDVFSAETRVFFFTGLAGGFTTFSAFALETFYLLRRDEVLVAGAYALSSIVVSLLVLWLGFVAVTPRTS